MHFMFRIERRYPVDTALNAKNYERLADVTLFIQHYFTEVRNSPISESVAETIHCFFDAYTMLSESKDRTKISVYDLTDVSGYSRTTFYKYFADVPEVHEMLEDIIIYHTNYFSPLYRIYYAGSDPYALFSTTNLLMRYTKYLKPLLRCDAFRERYKQTLKNIYVQGITEEVEMSNKSQILHIYFLESIAAANANMIVHFVEYGMNCDHLSEEEGTRHVRCMQIINNFFASFLKLIEIGTFDG